MNRRQLFGFMAAAPLVPVALAEAKEPVTRTAPQYKWSKPYVWKTTSACGIRTPEEARKLAERLLEAERGTKAQILEAWNRVRLA